MDPLYITSTSANACDSDMPGLSGASPSSTSVSFAEIGSEILTITNRRLKRTLTNLRRTRRDRRGVAETVEKVGGLDWYNSNY